MMSTTVLVTGATGRLGRLVVARLLAKECQVRALARHGVGVPAGADFYPGDLGNGEGLDAAVRGAATVVNCASSNKGEAGMTRNLVAAARSAGTPHLVQMSVVGIEHLATWGYPKQKLEGERIVEGGGVPWTILRATQFYGYILDSSRTLSRFPVIPVPAGFKVRPIDAAEVASRLVELALGEPAGRVTELAGPEESDWGAMLRRHLEVSGRRGWLLPVVIPGTAAVRRGGLLPQAGYDAGTRTWDQFLADAVAHPARAGR